MRTGENSGHRRLDVRDLGVGAKVGLSALLLVILGGFAASAQHLIWHHEKRDERPGLSMDDLTGAYHGVRTVAPMLRAMLRNHPEDLPAAERAALRSWVESGDIGGRYDDLDLGDMAPAEIIARSCLSCHARGAAQGDGIGQSIPLEYFDDVSRVSVSRDIKPTDTRVLMASTHAHALALGTLSIAVGALALATSWPRRLIGALLAVTGVSLAADLSLWWVASSSARAVWGIVVSGTLYSAGTVVLTLLVLAGTWLPRSRGG